MNIMQEFREQEWAAKLARRRKTFEHMCAHVALFNDPDCWIVETGTAWDKGNWAGQGQSTLIWDWLASKLKIQAVSVDIRAEAAAIANEQIHTIRLVVSDSVEFLNKFEHKSKIALLYLDSMDWTEETNIASALHHLKELAAVYAELPNGCMIAVDDRHGDEKGKHWLVENFMQNIGLKPVFKTHQIGWIKP